MCNFVTWRIFISLNVIIREINKPIRSRNTINFIKFPHRSKCLFYFRECSGTFFYKFSYTSLNLRKFIQLKIWRTCPVTSKEILTFSFYYYFCNWFCTISNNITDNVIRYFYCRNISKAIHTYGISYWFIVFYNQPIFLACFKMIYSNTIDTCTGILLYVSYIWNDIICFSFKVVNLDCITQIIESIFYFRDFWLYRLYLFDYCILNVFIKHSR